MDAKLNEGPSYLGELLRMVKYNFECGLGPLNYRRSWGGPRLAIERAPGPARVRCKRLREAVPVFPPFL